MAPCKRQRDFCPLGFLEILTEAHVSWMRGKLGSLVAARGAHLPAAQARRQGTRGSTHVYRYRHTDRYTGVWIDIYIYTDI